MQRRETREDMNEAFHATIVDLARSPMLRRSMVLAVSVAFAWRARWCFPHR